MSRTPTSTPSSAGTLAPEPLQQLPLGMGPAVRLSLEGSDLGAVEAAAAELKIRLGARFAITGRRLTTARHGLRISACLVANLDTVLDAEGMRQWAVPKGWDTHLVEDRGGQESGSGEAERGTGNADGDGAVSLTGMSQTD